MAGQSYSDNLLHFRLATANDVATIRNFLHPMFVSGSLGEKLAFGSLEIQDGLNYMLPRVVADPRVLLILAEFKPPSGMRSFPSEIVGVAHVRVPRPRQASQPSSEGLSLLKLQTLNRIKDIGLWPTLQTSEVCRRLLGELETMDMMRDHAQATERGDVCFLAVDLKFRGIGIGSRLLAYAERVVRDMEIGELSFVGVAEPARFFQQCGFSELRSVASGSINHYVKRI